MAEERKNGAARAFQSFVGDKFIVIGIGAAHAVGEIPILHRILSGGEKEEIAKYFQKQEEHTLGSLRYIFPCQEAIFQSFFLKINELHQTKIIDDKLYKNILLGPEKDRGLVIPYALLFSSPSVFYLYQSLLSLNQNNVIEKEDLRAIHSLNKTDPLERYRFYFCLLLISRVIDNLVLQMGTIDGGCLNDIENGLIRKEQWEEKGKHALVFSMFTQKIQGFTPLEYLQQSAQKEKAEEYLRYIRANFPLQWKQFCESEKIDISGNPLSKRDAPPSKATLKNNKKKKKKKSSQKINEVQKSETSQPVPEKAKKNAIHEGTCDEPEIKNTVQFQISCKHTDEREEKLSIQDLPDNPPEKSKEVLPETPNTTTKVTIQKSTASSKTQKRALKRKNMKRSRQQKQGQGSKPSEEQFATSPSPSKSEPLDNQVGGNILPKSKSPELSHPQGTSTAVLLTQLAATPLSPPLPAMPRPRKIPPSPVPVFSVAASITKIKKEPSRWGLQLEEKRKLTLQKLQQKIKTISLLKLNPDGLAGCMFSALLDLEENDLDGLMKILRENHFTLSDGRNVPLLGYVLSSVAVPGILRGCFEFYDHMVEAKGFDKLPEALGKIFQSPEMAMCFIDAEKEGEKSMPCRREFLDRYEEVFGPQTRYRFLAIVYQIKQTGYPSNGGYLGSENIPIVLEGAGLRF